MLYHAMSGPRTAVSDSISEILWSTGGVFCTLQIKDGRYEVLLRRDGRFVCLLSVISEDEARALADKLKIAETGRQEN